MQSFIDWMNAHGETDETVARKLALQGISLSRVQVTRIRRGQSGASKATAQGLEKLTGIPWHEFIEIANGRRVVS